MPPYNNADKYYGHTLSGYSDKIEIELSARTEALKNASWPVNDAKSSETNISQKDGNGNTERAAEPSERAKTLAEEIKKVDGQLQGYDALNEAIAANIEKEFGAMEYNAENLEKIKKYAGLKNSNAQNLDEVLKEIREGKLQEGERAFLKQLKGNLINEMGKELAEGEKSTIQTAENINAGIVNKTRGTFQGRTFYAKKIKGSSSTENAADMKIHNAAPTFTSETIEPEPFNNSIDDKNTKINEREKTLKENM